MQRATVTLIAVLAWLAASVAGGAAAEHCMTGDSAICAADLNCHWDFQRRGCYEGPAPHEDPCAAHTGKDICQADTTIGCKWDASANKCQSAK